MDLQLSKKACWCFLASDLSFFQINQSSSSYVMLKIIQILIIRSLLSYRIHTFMKPSFQIYVLLRFLYYSRIQTFYLIEADVKWFVMLLKCSILMFKQFFDYSINMEKQFGFQENPRIDAWFLDMFQVQPELYMLYPSAKNIIALMYQKFVSVLTPIRMHICWSYWGTHFNKS